MTADRPLVIYGAGGLGREVAVHIRRAGRKIFGFLDDGIEKGALVDGLSVLGGMDWLKQHPAEIVLAFGNPAVKKKVFDALQFISGIKISEKVIDPEARLLDPEHTRIGEGTVVTAGVVITTNIKIGTSVLINLNSTVGHDTTIGDFTSIMSGCNIAGKVKIGTSVLIGSGVNILGGIEIGDDAVIGSGSVVTRNVRQGVTVVGIPAREMSK